ncbi:ATP-dependent helicase HrpB [Corynebacterium poyangense]|uniref:RNA helicase n=1 Tax=Corynebacterium poyangense TaxID=2684405 RepID=A0A7H0SLA4_9CORY|nr:ATP-dependent helicase HrpB [Corynebacterium poyangense]QNQ89329.1 ATP-dependent helicase HrpB [Corynebacterium poyangense]
MPQIPAAHEFDCARIGAGLPVTQSLTEISRALTTSKVSIITAPPGTGKTTAVPPVFANQIMRAQPSGTHDSPGRVLVTIPRRVAARAAARRLLHLDAPGNSPSSPVGISVRGEHRPGTRIQFMTPGVLLRMLLKNPELPGVSAVVLDEVHERNVDTDLCLGMLLELQELREDLHVCIMSATLDVRRYRDLCGPHCQVINIPSPLHPVDIQWSPHRHRVHGSPDFWEHVAEQARGLYVDLAPHQQSIIVFAPGVREIDHVVAHLQAHDIPSFPLHGRLNNQQQDQVLTPCSQPRVIVASAIAESSLTVPGVYGVVDSTLSRQARRDSQRNMSGLVTLSASRDTMEQRAGRAGRQGPGRCIRCCSESEFHHAPAHSTPEIRTTDLSSTALYLACWGTPRGEGLVLLDSPPRQAIQAAEQNLQAIGAVDEQGRATSLGKQLAELPLEPYLAAALWKYACTTTPKVAHIVAATIAALSDRVSGDVAQFLDNGRIPGRIQAEQQRLEKIMERCRSTEPDQNISSTPTPGEIIATAFPLQVAQQVTAGSSEYLLASGTRARLPQDYRSLINQPWIAIAELSKSPHGTVIRSAARITQECAEAAVAPEESLTAEFHDGKLRFRCSRSLGAIELSSTPLSAAQVAATHPDAASSAVSQLIQHHGWDLFHFSPQAQRLKERMEFLHRQCGDPWPHLPHYPPETYAAAELSALAHGAAVDSIDMVPVLQRLLPWQHIQEFERLAPAELKLPSGHHHRIDYSQGRPIIRAKLQECFGLQESPHLAGGIRIQFHLLSPAGRPVAVTEDLASFWSGPYHQVRAEMRGRYPKHPWPEDPRQATATAATKAQVRRHNS